jgi:hypothetical protein
MFSYGRLVLALLALVFSNGIFGQTIYYPANSSQLLKSTANDLASLFRRAMPGGDFAVQEYGSTMPSQGIIFKYDNSIGSGNTCKVESDGIAVLRFTAAEDNGLNFGAYRYMAELGFRFYLPGTIWEKIPAISSPFKTINKNY